jgi:OmpA-OmpF porin, OOP family
MSFPRGICAAAALFTSLTLVPALAKAGDPPFDPAIDVQLYDYSIGPKTFFSVADADVAAKKQLTVDMFVTFLTNPFTVYNVAPGENMITGTRTRVVKSILAGQLSGAYGISDKLQVGLMLPMVFSMAGDGLDPKTAMPASSELRVAGLGDLAAELKFRLVHKNDWRVALIGGVTLPSSFGSGGSQFIGDNLPTVRGRAALQWVHGKVSIGANLGVILRKPREIYASEIGQQMTWNAGAALRVTERFSVVGEIYGRTGLFKFDLDRSPMEASGGVRVQATNSIAVVAGGGGGLIKGIGSPDVRAFLSIGYAPDIRDTDGDAVPNGRDECPLVPEDRDGFKDSDGCPDDDNDGDRRDDAIDKCPNEAEDIDGFDDDDGCPDLDNDGDGIADLDDKCVMDKEDGQQPAPTDGCPAGKRDSDGDGMPDNMDACPTSTEDVDGFEDEDGCPEADNDQDGVPDATDECPLCPEDKDGFQDDDGCPDFDDDHDGVPDSADKCPKEVESINGVDDGDGCPDTGGINLARLDGDKLVVDRVPSFDRKGLTKGGEIIVDQMALVMSANHEVTNWLIAFANSGNNVAAETEWIKARLVLRGVAATKIEMLGAPGTPRIGGVVRERAEADAPKSCPVEKQVKPRAVKAAAAAAAAAPATPATPAVSPKPAVTPAPVVTPAPAASKPATTTAPAPVPVKPTAKPMPPAPVQGATKTMPTDLP